MNVILWTGVFCILIGLKCLLADRRTRTQKHIDVLRDKKGRYANKGYQFRLTYDGKLI